GMNNARCRFDSATLRLTSSRSLLPRSAMMRSTFGILLGFATVVLLTGAAQQPTKKDDKKDDKKDPQSSFEPRSKPGWGKKFLEKFVGDWDVAKSFHPRRGEPVKQKGECRQTMIHGGRFLESQFTFQTGSEKTTGTGLIGFEPETGKFTSVWVDSRQTRMSL